jgi:hypothetical protein
VFLWCLLFHLNQSKPTREHATAPNLKREEITVLTFNTPLESARRRSDVLFVHPSLDTVAGGHRVGYFRVDVIFWLSFAERA